MGECRNKVISLFFSGGKEEHNTCYDIILVDNSNITLYHNSFAEYYLLSPFNSNYILLYILLKLLSTAL